MCVRRAPQLASPRVNKALLPSFIGRRVSLVGKTVGDTGTVLTLQAADGQNVTVHLGAAGSPTTCVLAPCAPAHHVQTG